jgi:hypothetical protein
MNIKFIQSVKDLLTVFIVNSKDNPDKAVGYAKMNGKLVELSNTLKKFQNNSIFVLQIQLLL